MKQIFSKLKKLPGATSALLILGIALFISLWQDHSDMAEFLRDFCGYLLLVGIPFAVYKLKLLRTQTGVIKKHHVLSEAFSYIPLALGFIAYYSWMSFVSTHVAFAVLRKDGVVETARVSSYHYVYEQLFPGWLLGYRTTDNLGGLSGYEVVHYRLNNGASGILDIPIDTDLYPDRYSRLLNQINFGYIQVRYLPGFSQLAIPNTEFTNPANNPPH